MQFIQTATTAIPLTNRLRGTKPGGSMIDPSLIDPLCPVVSDLGPEEQAASYDRWFRAEVQASLDDPRPSIPHEQVMEEMNALMESMRKSADAD